MLNNLSISKLFFIDIESAPYWPSFEQMPVEFRKHWEHKAMLLSRNADETPEKLYGRAGIYAEFARVICISSAYFFNGQLRVKSFAGDNEHDLLSRFAEAVHSFFLTPGTCLVAHNGKEFDFPVIARRMLVNSIPLPAPFDLAGKKPWEVPHIDTMDLWKFGDYKNFTSLALLATLFGLPSPKDDISGADVGKVYWIDHDLPRIVTYCQKDTVTLARLIQKFRGETPVGDSQIVVVE